MASRIEVSEHASAEDFYPLEKKSSDLPVYRTVTLSTAQQADLLASIEAMPDGTAHMAAACVINPHHTLHFYRGNQLHSKLVICFICSQLIWRNDLGPEPEALYGEMSGFLTRIGLHPDQDWPAVAAAFTQAPTVQHQATH
ncbi:hypothetical protein [Andreprevotia lacus]|uniref:hypothetical protein n=1 Tax=Andreprevotia lacus TaxID=1121000 RepID=UPI0009FF4598|nr:hypothetical protein [Andreprevotia lacus]